MHAQKECYPCLEGLARRTAELAAAGSEEKEKVLAAGLAYLEQNFSFARIPTQVAGEMQRVMRAAARCEDPFRRVKEKEMEAARRLAGATAFAASDSWTDLISLAARGNSLDFFLDLDRLAAEMGKPVSFAREDSGALISLLNSFRGAPEEKTILYLADNAGECYFDLPLVKKLGEFARVVYVVKENPVQNDLTRRDLEKSGIKDEFPCVMTTGSDTPGLDLSLVSPEFREALRRASLLFAKGMGYFETLPELRLPVPVFFLLKAKCLPIARSLHVPLNSYVACFLPGVV